jgi:Coenzyme PQQ synthesis protein D (PqqD)
MRSWRLRETDLEWRRIDDEIVALDLRSGTYLTLNGTGADLFERISTGATTDELVAVITDGYETTPDRARLDVMAFLDDLESRGLVDGRD